MKLVRSVKLRYYPRPKLVITLDIPRELAERLSAQAIREGINLDAVVVAMLGN